MIFAFALIITSSFCQTFIISHSELLQNSTCQWKVSKKYRIIDVSKYTANNITSVITESCIEKFEITLEDKLHFESILINIKSLILINGRVQNNKKIDKWTIWQVNTSNEFIIGLDSGELTLQYLKFDFTTNNTIICPTKYLIFATNSSFDYQSLTIQYCAFIGLKNDTQVGQMIVALNLDKIVLKESIFMDTTTNSKNLIHFESNNNNSQIIIDNIQFKIITIINFSAQAALTILTTGSNSSIIINESQFNSCVSSSFSYAGAVYIYSSPDAVNNSYIITNNQFSNNTGYDTGAIAIWSSSNQFKLSFNQFINNRQTGSHNANDAYLEWGSYPDGWTKDNIKDILTSFLEGSTSNNENSVYYEAIKSHDVDTSGYINLPNPPDDQKQSSKMKIVMTVGIVIGAFILISSLAIGILFIVRWKKSNEQHTIQNEGETVPYSTLDNIAAMNKLQV